MNRLRECGCRAGCDKPPCPGSSYGAWPECRAVVSTLALSPLPVTLAQMIHCYGFLPTRVKLSSYPVTIWKKGSIMRLAGGITFYTAHMKTDSLCFLNQVVQPVTSTLRSQERERSAPPWEVLTFLGVSLDFLGGHRPWGPPEENREGCCWEGNMEIFGSSL